MADQDESAAVLFNRQNLTIHVDPPVIAVKAGDVLDLVFTVTTIGSGSGEATFAPGSQAIEFPRQKPPGLTVNGQGTKATLQETNNNTSSMDFAYCYRVVLDFNGQEFKSTDPHIINEGEPPPDGEEDEEKGGAKRKH